MRMHVEKLGLWVRLGRRPHAGEHRSPAAARTHLKGGWSRGNTPGAIRASRVLLGGPVTARTSQPARDGVVSPRRGHLRRRRVSGLLTAAAARCAATVGARL